MHAEVSNEPDQQSCDELQDNAAGGCSARSEWEAQADHHEDFGGSRSTRGGRCSESALGGTSGKQGKCAVRAESRHSQRGPQCSHSERLRLLVRLERKPVAMAAFLREQPFAIW